MEVLAACKRNDYCSTHRHGDQLQLTARNEFSDDEGLFVASAQWILWVGWNNWINDQYSDTPFGQCNSCDLHHDDGSFFGLDFDLTDHRSYIGGAPGSAGADSV
jgi:hypothetical protein